MGLLNHYYDATAIGKQLWEQNVDKLIYAIEKKLAGGFLSCTPCQVMFH